jgi:phosphoribosylformylglycinamidine synthase subunit PurL
MLSESQERMLLVVKKGREAEVERIFDKWDLHAAHIGQVTTDGLMRVKNHGEVVAEIPNTALTDEAPLYKRPMREPEYLAEAQRLSLSELGTPTPAREAFRALLASPGIASKRWVYHQYDHMVRTNTLVLPGMGAGVVRVKGTERALAMSVDCNARYVYLDPYLGAQHAVAEAARNVACTGAQPIAATNCLNFGNPQRPEIMWQFARAVEGMGAACRALDVPITGGNVSLYNETDGTAVLPTPTLGVVGLIEHADRVVRRAFRAAGDVVMLIGESRAELGGSEYLKVLHGLIRGVPPQLDLTRERKLHEFLVAAIESRLLQSAHDCADGGLAITVAESCFDTGEGAEVDVPAVDADAGFSDIATLFGESASRVVVSVDPANADEVMARAAAAKLPAVVIGRVGGERIVMKVNGRVVIDEVSTEAERIWSTAIEQHFEQSRAVA